jgi:spore germination protein GerM
MREEQGSSPKQGQKKNQEKNTNTNTNLNAVENDGAVVLQEVVRMTGLSSDYLDGALSGLLGRPDTSVNDLSLDELRNLLLDCLESLNEQMGSEPTESNLN